MERTFCLFVLFCFKRHSAVLTLARQSEMTAGAAGPYEPFKSVHLHVLMFLLLSLGSETNSSSE